MEPPMVQRLLLVLLAIAAPTTPSLAFEVEQGQCQRILSGQARVRIHYDSGIMAELEPVDANNVMSEVDVLPDGRKRAHKWIGGGLLPLENPNGKFTYADREATVFLFEVGEARRLSFTFSPTAGRTTSGTVAVVVEQVEKRAFGECQATFITIAITVTWAHAAQSTRLSRLFVREFGFFVESVAEQVRDGKPAPIRLKAARIELIE
jgi:hypothetical protein